MTTSSRSDRQTRRPGPLRFRMSEVAAGLLVATALLAASACGVQPTGRSTLSGPRFPAPALTGA